ncbi:hypothetical protein [Rhizobium tubonense]|uniref:Uncharacterized protein n=1 Tax=Rhizobium tubonense TaxID=484088 RepID=A0A2W4CJQ2_9HYPH|nr:hypothetical protein [Rhizobium tubonense]PZM13207.1 hypothetical protein CPY51_15040 [Rhizobium tubonense]
MNAATTFPNQDAVADKFAAFAEGDKAFIKLLMENALQDESLIDGLHRHLDRSAKASFLNALKLEKIGEWLGNSAPTRLQIRLMEAAKASQHPAYAALKTGLTRSGGLDRAYPKI